MGAENLAELAQLLEGQVRLSPGAGRGVGVVAGMTKAIDGAPEFI